MGWGGVVQQVQTVLNLFVNESPRLINKECKQSLSVEEIMHQDMGINALSITPSSFYNGHLKF